MHSPGRGLAVQGRGAQAAALADALASLRRTRARMASLTAYGTAGGRAGGPAGRGSRTGTPGNFGVRLWSVGAAREGAEPLGSGTHIRITRRMEDAWEPGGGYLPVESGDPKRLTFGSLGSPEKFHSLEFLQGTRGVRSCLGFEPWTWGTRVCSEAALSLPDLGQVI